MPVVIEEMVTEPVPERAAAPAPAPAAPAAAAPLDPEAIERALDQRRERRARLWAD